MRTPRVWLLVIAALSLGGLVGCGSPSAPVPPTSSTVEHGSFAQCLREHGVDESAVSPVGVPVGVDPATWEAAIKACGTLAPGPAGP